MPGAASLFGAIDPILLADHPENVELWLPSALPSSSRDTWCVRGLPLHEYRLRVAQATNALQGIRRLRRLLCILAVKSNSHITNTQKTGTRSRSVFDKTNDQHNQAVKTYHVAWNAIANLAPNEEFGRWKDTLRDLKKDDLHGPGPEEYEVSASRYVQSWIWTTTSPTSTSTNDADLDAALRVEWCKVQERAKHYEEEEQLVIEEMRRTLVTLGLTASDWEGQATLPSPRP